MNGRDLRLRAEIVIVFGACAISLAHGGAQDEAAMVRARSFALALALTSFGLACLGMLLIIQGARLRDGPVSACERAERNRAAVRRGRAESATREIRPMLLWDPGFGGGRLALTTFLILRAQQQARACKTPTTER